MSYSCSQCQYATAKYFAVDNKARFGHLCSSCHSMCGRPAEYAAIAPPVSHSHTQEEIDWFEGKGKYAYVDNLPAGPTLVDLMGYIGHKSVDVGQRQTLYVVDGGFLHRNMLSSGSLQSETIRLKSHHGTFLCYRVGVEERKYPSGRACLIMTYEVREKLAD